MAGTVTHDPPPDTGGRQGGPLIVTEDAELLDDLLRLCAAAGATPEVHHGVPERRGSWEAAPLVLVGDDAARRLRGAGAYSAGEPPAGTIACGDSRSIQVSGTFCDVD
ncbi:hypothetical protein ABT317_46600, partial [Streptomyces carpinensis]